jgi:hypothetical protein
MKRPVSPLALAVASLAISGDFVGAMALSNLHNREKIDPKPRELTKHNLERIESAKLKRERKNNNKLK